MPATEQSATATAKQNKQFVIQHFEDFVNRRDLDAIERNMTPDFLDHDGPGGKPTGRDGDRAMMAQMHQLFPDLRVTVQGAVAEGDRVVVRNVWTATDGTTGARMEFHGFVEWRLAGGKIAERWATVTAPRELTAEPFGW